MMPNDTDSDVIHVRCDAELKRMVKVASGVEDKSLSDYVRETLRDDVEEKGITSEMIEELR